MYSFLRFLHIFVAIFGMGPHFVAILLLRAIRRNPESYPHLGPILRKVSKMPRHGAPVMLLTGVLLVWQSGAGRVLGHQPWLMISLVLFVFYVAYGRFGTAKPEQALQAMEASGEFNAAVVTGAIGAMTRALTIMGVALIGIVMLMVFKPTLLP